jgi:hypothetical protein
MEIPLGVASGLRTFSLRVDSVGRSPWCPGGGHRSDTIRHVSARPPGEGPEFHPGWWRSWGKPTVMLILGAIAVAAVVVVALLIVGVLFD